MTALLRYKSKCGRFFDGFKFTHATSHLNS